MAKGIQDRTQTLEKLAGKQSRKEIEKALSKARRDYNAARTDHDRAKSELGGLQNRVDKAHGKMESTRKTVTDLNNCIHKMDLTGAVAIRDRGEDVGYILDDGREYHVDSSDSNDIRCTPWREYKKRGKEDVGNVDDDVVDDEGTIIDFSFADDDGIDLDIGSRYIAQAFREALGLIKAGS